MMMLRNTNLPEPVTNSGNQARPAEMTSLGVVILFARTVTANHTVGVLIRMRLFFVMTSLCVVIKKSGQYDGWVSIFFRQETGIDIILTSQGYTLLQQENLCYWLLLSV
jgi:hypothetical protein